MPRRRIANRGATLPLPEEITPAMVSAGIAVLDAFGDFYADVNLVVALYVAMHQAADAALPPNPV